MTNPRFPYQVFSWCKREDGDIVIRVVVQIDEHRPSTARWIESRPGVIAVELPRRDNIVAIVHDLHDPKEVQDEIEAYLAELYLEVHDGQE